MCRSSLWVLWLLFAIGTLAGIAPGIADAQLTATEEEKLQLLTDPESIKQKTEKDKTRPPLEFFRSQVAPFDVLPYVKANHWSTFSLDLKSNEGDYEGVLQTLPLPLRNMPQAVVFGREARLVKDQRTTLNFQALCSEIPKEMPLELMKPGAIRVDGVWQASLLRLSAHQMLVMVLSTDATSRFGAWARLGSTIPYNVSGGDVQAVDQRRYYRMVLPTEPDKIYLSSHPLAWSTLSHIIWDGLSPDALNVSQQQAMLDWIHWGGQLIIFGGPGATATLFQESFLAPYLPADRSGESVALSTEDLKQLADFYPPPTHEPYADSRQQDTDADPVPVTAEQLREQYELRGRRYRKPQPIPSLSKSPIYASKLKARAGATIIPLSRRNSLNLAVESRIGRGRITMLAFNPNEPALLAWRGVDTLIRRVVLRRPEEPRLPRGDVDKRPFIAQDEPIPLTGRDLSWYRIASRDGLGQDQPKETESDSLGVRQSLGSGVASWLDDASLPRLSRDILEQASGISIPSSGFVLKVILAYILALVPLNWLFCRFILRRREWSWFFIPILSIAFAVVVERVAAFDVGFDSGCDEIDLIEFQGGHDRAHLSRFSALYTTGRGQFSLSFPNDPTALALPLDTGRSIVGEDISTSNWQSFPVPTLSGFSVQPRSLGMVRSEQMLRLRGGIVLEEEAGKRRVVNQTEFELRDATVIEFQEDGQPVSRPLGTILAGATVDLDNPTTSDPAALSNPYEGPDPSRFLDTLRTSRESRSENAGEVRLVAWIPKPMGGMKIEPEVDRHRGFTAVLAHLRFGPPPDPSGLRYNDRSESKPPEFVEPPEPPSVNRPSRGRGAFANFVSIPE